MVDKNELLEQLERLEKFNNSDVPEWVKNVIRGMPDDKMWETMMETKICNNIDYCEDCPRFADDRDGDPDMMRGEEE